MGSLLLAPGVVGLEDWAVRAILERWLELSEGGRARRLAGEAVWDGAGYSEPSELLWFCTVGSKLERCPRLPVDPGDPASPRMPAVEQEVRINAGLAERRNQLEALTRIINRSNTGKRSNVTTITPFYLDRARLRREIEWGDRRAAELARSPEYRMGWTYLVWVLARCVLDDPSFRAWTDSTVWLAGPDAILRAAVARHGYTVRQISDRLGVMPATVTHWMAAPGTRRRVQMPIRYAAALRDMLAAA